MFDLAPSSGTDARNASKETCMAYNENATQYVEATKGYEDFPGLREEVLAFAAASSAGSPVLDLGSGGGRDSRLLEQNGKQVVSGDICLKLLRQARELAYGRSNIGNVCLDSRQIPFRQATFGGVWACGSLLHLPMDDLPSALAEIFRVLQPGGIAVINMQAGSAEGWRTGGTLPGRRWFTLIDPGALASLMEKCGFRQMTYRLVGREGWFLMDGYKPRLARLSRLCRQRSGCQLGTTWRIPPRGSSTSP